MSSGSIPPGYRFEEEFFGPRVKVEVAHHLPFEAAVLDAKSKQARLGWDPQKPKTRLGSDFYMYVQSYVRPSNWNRLRLYNSIGTCLDQEWHTDCFFELSDKARVTIDLTLLRRKEYNRYMSADYLLTKEKMEYIGLYGIARHIGWMLERKLHMLQPIVRAAAAGK